MRCKSCGNELSIHGAFTEAREENGRIAVYSVVDLVCTDPQCPIGAKGIPTERVRRPVHSAGEALPNAVSCCGVPLAYTGEQAYHIPDTQAIEQQTPELVTLRCGQCGARHELYVKGKTAL